MIRKRQYRAFTASMEGSSGSPADACRRRANQIWTEVKLELLGWALVRATQRNEMGARSDRRPQGWRSSHSASARWFVQDGDGTFPADPKQSLVGRARGVGEHAGGRSKNNQRATEPHGAAALPAACGGGVEETRSG